jgi:hypothetical protein
VARIDAELVVGRKIALIRNRQTSRCSSVGVVLRNRRIEVTPCGAVRAAPGVRSPCIVLCKNARGVEAPPDRTSSPCMPGLASVALPNDSPISPVLSGNPAIDTQRPTSS